MLDWSCRVLISPLHAPCTVRAEVIERFAQKPLKGQCQEVFDLRFFHQTIPPRPLIHGLKPF
jgi:hypothetical protein